ncbi:hypothetical protein IFM89_039719 [Coptis chinensis]|uniref:Serine/threonine-protein kinase 11-interacting protein n=1 Tax=Coptis chinensis TaxID=261450 RepID=A0A835L9I3_9MAGN|nr:hypothetical protein IFM89_039719 [Coptis chinensis]
MAIVTGDSYLEYLVKFVEKEAGPLLESTLILKLNPVGLHYVQSRLESLQELESLLINAPVDYLRAYISDLGDHRALEQLRRILRLLTCLKVVSVLPPPDRDPTPLSLLPFGRLKVLELRGCDLSTSPAKGLLQLRHTLEKLILHNSTDALRHVFASRIVDVKDSAVWNRLFLVSCPCNGLLLMDDSLQLLPNVETLDLSRNRFAKIDNLKKCTKLKHLDLGFNHLRSISSLTEVACSIVKLVLRNNALTSLNGIETLKSIEGLDLSYNVISNVSELEILASLPFLQSLWLEGNPICCAPWYRAQVFSLFAHPEKLKLDERGITTRESWKRQIVLASKLKRPAGFGFYSPAIDNDEDEGTLTRDRKKLTRLALIEDEEQRRSILSEAVEQDSGSCESEIRSREETVVSDSEAEVAGLMNRVEFMKKEYSVLWLREFKDWMDQPSESLVSSKHSGEENRTDVLEPANSVEDISIGSHDHNNFDLVGEVALKSSTAECKGDSRPHVENREVNFKQVQVEVCSQEGFNCLPLAEEPLLPDSLTSQRGMKNVEVSPTLVTAIDEMMELHHLSSSYPRSPPHYQEDILHRRHNLEEEFMQLSVESYSLASSDSDTSNSDDEYCRFDTSLPEVDHSPKEPDSGTMDDHSEMFPFEDTFSDGRHATSHIRRNGRSLFNYCSDQASRIKKFLREDHYGMGSDVANVDVCDIENSDDQDAGFSSKMKRKHRLKQRIVSLSDEKKAIGCGNLLPPKQNGIEDVSVADMEVLGGSDCEKCCTDTYKDTFFIEPTFSQLVTEDFIESYFHANVANSSASEICLQSMLCDCMLQKESEYKESKVIILLSSAANVYVLLMDSTSDGSGFISEVIGCHRIGEINEVVIGIGLQLLRVHIETDTTYLFVTKSVEKSRELLSLLHVCDSNSTSNKCSLKSAEQAQVELFEKHICGGTKMSIFLYSILLFWSNNNEEESSLSRSLFVIEGYIILCVEDLVHFAFNTLDDALASSYFSLDLCCSISNISELCLTTSDCTYHLVISQLLFQAIEPKDGTCVTLTLDSEKFHSDLKNEKTLNHLEQSMVTGSHKWKLKWFSEEILLKFVALLKALHAETAMRPLTIRC